MHTAGGRTMPLAHQTLTPCLPGPHPLPTRPSPLARQALTPCPPDPHPLPTRRSSLAHLSARTRGRSST
eukprot:191442-Chlamydomonas_euryale.AAC.2